MARAAEAADATPEQGGGGGGGHGADSSHHHHHHHHHEVDDDPQLDKDEDKGEGEDAVWRGHIIEGTDPDALGTPYPSLASRLTPSPFLPATPTSTYHPIYPIYPPPHSSLPSSPPSASSSSSFFSSPYSYSYPSSTCCHSSTPSSSLSLDTQFKAESAMSTTITATAPPGITHMNLLGKPEANTTATTAQSTSAFGLFAGSPPTTGALYGNATTAGPLHGNASPTASAISCCPKLEAITAKTPPSPYSQLPLRVTLDSLALSSLSALFILILHFGNLLLVELAVAVVVPALWVYNDYQNFLRLGPGGTPSTPRGYLKLKWLGLFTLSDPFTAPPTPPELVPTTGLFSRSKTRLPFRVGPRPTVAGLAPQRQTDQLGSEKHYAALTSLLTSLPSRLPEKFSAAKSTLEKHGLALYSCNPVYKITRGEICHVHASDHSLHLSLHPDDAREVLEKQWGERHPLGSISRFGEMPIAPYFTMIYAPQDDEQFDAVCKIIEAAIWFVSMEDVTLDVKIRR